MADFGIYTDALLARERESLAMERPTKRNHLNLIHWVWNKRAIAKSEIELLNRIDDFVVLSRDQDSPFHTFLEDLLQRFPLSWIQVETPPALKLTCSC